MPPPHLGLVAGHEHEVGDHEGRREHVLEHRPALDDVAVLHRQVGQAHQRHRGGQRSLQPRRARLAPTGQQRVRRQAREADRDRAAGQLAERGPPHVVHARGQHDAGAGAERDEESPGDEVHPPTFSRHVSFICRLPPTDPFSGSEMPVRRGCRWPRSRRRRPTAPRRSGRAGGAGRPASRARRGTSSGPSRSTSASATSGPSSSAIAMARLSRTIGLGSIAASWS